MTTPRLLTVLIVLACVWFWHAAILQNIAWLLIVDRQQAQPDWVCIRTEDGLSCDGDRCYDRAAQLYREDTLRGILLIEPYPTRLVQIGVLPCFEAISRCQLEARGVPNKAVFVITGKAENPWQEARLLDRWLEDRSRTRVLLLCNRFESRRWRIVLDTVLQPDHAARVGILALPDRRYDETDWWKSRRGVKGFFYGCLALAYAWFQGEDVSPRELWDPDDYQRMLKRAVGKAS